MLRTLYTFVLGIAALAGLRAQTLIATISKNPVNAGERFRLEYTFNGNGSGNNTATNFTAPLLKDFTVLAGPVQNSRTIIANQKIETIPSVYFDLSCSKEGTYTISPASVEFNGKTIRSAELKITINPAPVVSNASSTVELRVQPAQNTCMNGEMVNCKIQVVSSADDIYSVSRLNAVSDDDADISGLTMNQSVQKSLESINGVSRYIYDVGSMNVTPKKEGKVSVPQASLDVVVLRKQKFTSPFENDPLLGDKAMGLPEITVQVPTRVTLKANPAALSVTQTPVAGRPSNYIGAVGNNFSLSCSVDRNTLHTNEAVTLNVTIAGEGNTNSVQPPALTMPAEFDSYPPNISDSSSGNYSSRNFQYVAVPRSEGTFTIPSANISYYDAGKKDYVNLATPEFNVKVVKPGTPITEPGLVKADSTRQAPGELKALKTTFSNDSGDLFFGSPLFIFLLCIPLLFFSIFIFRKQMMNEETVSSEYIPPPDDAPHYEGSSASPETSDPLEAARLLESGNDTTAFCAALEKGIVRYFSRHLNNTGTLSADEICAALEAKGTDGQIISEIRSVLEQCALSRFGGLALSSGEHENLLKRTESFLPLNDPTAS